jgi:hypothetical protein
MALARDKVVTSAIRSRPWLPSISRRRAAPRTDQHRIRRIARCVRGRGPKRPLPLLRGLRQVRRSLPSEFKGRNVLSISTITEGNVDSAWSQCDVIVRVNTDAAGRTPISKPTARWPSSTRPAVTVWSCLAAYSKLTAVSGARLSMSIARDCDAHRQLRRQGRPRHADRRRGPPRARPAGSQVISRDEDFT